MVSKALCIVRLLSCARLQNSNGHSPVSLYEHCKLAVKYIFQSIGRGEVRTRVRGHVKDQECSD